MMSDRSYCRQTVAVPNGLKKTDSYFPYDAHMFAASSADARSPAPPEGTAHLSHNTFPASLKRDPTQRSFASERFPK